MVMAPLIIFLPLIGALFSGVISFVGYKKEDRIAQVVSIFCVGFPAVLSIDAIYQTFVHGQIYHVEFAPWISVENLQITWGLYVDSLTALMLGVVTGVSLMVHIYSVGYMSHDQSKARFFSYLNLFTFFMLVLVSADDLAQMFVGWEGVGISSYLLIGFWHHKDSANLASVKAFVVNRVGDIGFVLGISATYMLFDTINFKEIFPQLESVNQEYLSFFGFRAHGISLACLLLFIGAMGKSAQLGLHVWLPDAMEGPTPVSALIHAATMVTAGVFMLVRMSFMFEYAPEVLKFVAILGALTALFAATVALTQNDIKKVIAYSTCSQLGYMFMACGAGAYSMAMFHLTTHAFFKALLFLGAGSVIHAMSNEQDMRKMGGLWNKIPTTYALMWIGSLALAGIPLFAGYYSKDLILENLWFSAGGISYFPYVLGIFGAFLTAFYSWRLLMMTFHGKSKADLKVLAHVHESPIAMMVPMVVLAIGAIFSGMLMDGPFKSSAIWKNIIFVKDLNQHLPLIIHYLPLVVALGGLVLGILFYTKISKIPSFLSKKASFLYSFFHQKWYFDELYHKVFVSTTCWAANFLKVKVDKKIIDKYGPDGIANLVLTGAEASSKWQTGQVVQYAVVMLLSIILFLTWLLCIQW